MATSEGKLDIKKLSATFASNADLVGIAATADNKLIVSDSFAAQDGRSDEIYTLIDTGDAKTALDISPEKIESPEGIAVQEVASSQPTLWLTDYESQMLFWKNLEDNTKGKIDLGSKAAELHSRGLAYGNFATEELIVVAQEGTSKGHVFVINAKTKTVLNDRTQEAPDKGLPTNIILDTATKRAFVGDYANSRIYYFDPTTKADAANLFTALELQSTQQDGTVYGLALNPKMKCVWALDQAGMKLYRIDKIDTVPTVNPDVINLSALGLSDFWDVAIDSEGYLWLPCVKAGKYSILQLNADGNVVNVSEVPGATYLDTLAIAPYSPSQSHDVICVLNRSKPGAIHEIKPGTVAGDHDKGPNPDPRVLSKNLKFTVSPNPPLKAIPNGDFPEFKVTVTDTLSGNVVTNFPIEIRITDAHTKTDLTIVPAKAGADAHATATYAAFVTDGVTGIATIPAGTLKAGPNVDKNLNIQVTARGATAQVVPCEIAAPFKLVTTLDKEEWKRRTTGIFTLQVNTDDNQSGHEVKFALSAGDYANGARFIDPTTGSETTQNPLAVRTGSSGDIALKLKAGNKLGIYVVTATAAAAINNSPQSLNKKHVNPVPSEITVNVTTAHPKQFGKAVVTVKGLDDASKLVTVPHEPLHFTLATFDNTNTSDVTAATDVNQRCSFFANGHAPTETSTDITKFWAGKGAKSATPGLECIVESDINGTVEFNLATADIPAIRTMPLNDYVKLTAQLVEETSVPLGGKSDSKQIRH